MKDFNLVAIVLEKNPVDRGFMFEYIQQNFPYAAWQPVGYAVMDAFEKTFGDMKAHVYKIQENRERFVTAVQEELKMRLGEQADDPAYLALTEKIRAMLQPETPSSTPAAEPAKALVPHAKL